MWEHAGRKAISCCLSCGSCTYSTFFLGDPELLNEAARLLETSPIPRGIQHIFIIFRHAPPYYTSRPNQGARMHCLHQGRRARWLHHQAVAATMGHDRYLGRECPRKALTAAFFLPGECGCTIESAMATLQKEVCTSKTKVYRGWSIDRCASDGQPSPSLAEFVARNDCHLYDQKMGLARLIDRAEVRLVNRSDNLEQLHHTLEELDLTNEQRLRPGWDQYFMQLASLAAQRSNCMKRRVGSVLVREKRVISTGYNGTPRYLKNCNEGGCQCSMKAAEISGWSDTGLRCNEGTTAGVGLSTCLCLHAEENALLEAGRERIREGSILYCDT